MFKKLRKGTAIILSLMLMLSGIAFNPTSANAANSEVGNVAKVGTEVITGIEFKTNISGADVYIKAASGSGGDLVDADRQKEVVTPCAVELSPGSYDIELRIAGYKTDKATVTVTDGATAVVDAKLVADLPEVAAETTITVNNSGDNAVDDNRDLILTPDLTVEEVKAQAEITLRDAVTAILNDDTKDSATDLPTHYQINFASGITEIVLNDQININKRGHLSINGDTNQDGKADVSIEKPEAGFKYYSASINVVATDSYIVGLKFINLGVNTKEATYNALSMRIPAESTEKNDIENLYVLGCEFTNSFEVGAATGGYAGDAGKEYGGEGTTNYTNLVFAGNNFDRTNCFSFVGCGDEDYNVIDGYTVMANIFTNAGIGMLAGDANTRYVFGEDAEIGFSDYNILKNVLVSGNSITMDENALEIFQGIIIITTSNLGNSNNTVDTVMIRNNISRIKGGEANLHSAVNIDNLCLGEPFIKLETHTSGNTAKNITVEYNDFQMGDGRAFLVRNTISGIDLLGEGEGDNNTMENINIHHNKIDASVGVLIANYEGPSHCSKAENNNMNGIKFEDNIVTTDDYGKHSDKTGILATGAWISNGFGSEVMEKSKYPDFKGEMKNIAINRNSVSGFPYGIVASGSLGDYVDGLGIDTLAIKDNEITTVGEDGKFGIAVAGAVFGTFGNGEVGGGPYQPGSTNAFVKNAEVSGNKVSAKGGIAVAGGLYDGAPRADSIAGNYVDGISVKNNILAHIAAGDSKSFPPTIAADIIDINAIAERLKPDMMNSTVRSVTFTNNTVATGKTFPRKALDLTKIPRSIKGTDGATEESIIRDYTVITDDVCGANSFEWSFVTAFDKNKSGDYLLKARGTKQEEVQYLFHQITWTAGTPQPASHTITYHLNGGTIAGEKESYSEGDAFTFVEPTKTGHSFAGWYANSSFSGAAITGIKATDTGSKIFYAKWVVNTYRVTFNLNGGTRTGGGELSQTVDYASAAVAPVAIQKGYKFASWDKVLTNITATQTITARWAAVKVDSVKLNKSSATVARGKSITLKATVTPTRALNKAVTWKSSNTKYATVTSAGKVTIKKNAKKGKTVTITCTAKDGSGKKATCKIKIK